jgi:hypothetical protein
VSGYFFIFVLQHYHPPIFSNYNQNSTPKTNTQVLVLIISSVIIIYNTLTKFCKCNYLVFINFILIFYLKLIYNIFILDRTNISTSTYINRMFRVWIKGNTSSTTLIIILIAPFSALIIVAWRSLSYVTLFCVTSHWYNCKIKSIIIF